MLGKTNPAGETPGGRVPRIRAGAGRGQAKSGGWNPCILDSGLTAKDEKAAVDK